MPKVVDRDARQSDIVQATWRVIAREGIAATTMRGLARELGYANGALAVYFPNKQAILAAAFAHIYSATNARYFSERASGLRATAALRAFLIELFPLDEERLLEARIVIPFLEYAAHDSSMRELWDRSMDDWESELDTLLSEMVADGEAASDLDRRGYIDHVLAVTHGVQATSILAPASAEPQRLMGVIDSILRAAR